MKAGGVMIIEWKQKENIMVLRWFDNKSVHILSTYIGLFPLEKAKRWDRKKKDYIKVQMPHAIAEYNKFMRGVDLCDMFLELYRIYFKSKKWYMRIFFYVLDLATINGWLLYRRTLNKKSKQHMSLCDFKLDIATGLLSSNKYAPKRGRPSQQDNPSKTPKKRKKLSIQQNLLNGMVVVTNQAV